MEDSEIKKLGGERGGKGEGERMGKREEKGVRLMNLMIFGRRKGKENWKGMV
jgi:hypothetical protein